MNTKAERLLDGGFVLGSITEFERVCSMPKHVFTDHLRAMFAQLLNFLLLMRYNEEYSDVELISEAGTKLCDQVLCM